MRTTIFTAAASVAVFAGAFLTFTPFLVAAQSTAMTAPSSPSSFMMCPAFIRSLSIGSRGEDVTELQQFLKIRGFFNVDPTGYYGSITASGVRQWQVSARVVSNGNAGLGIFGPLSRAFLTQSCGVPPGSESLGSTTTALIQQVNAPASVSLVPNGIAEVRNEHMYFTLTNLTSTSATIQTTPVGCWNWFPSDSPPQIRCMIAVMPIAPQTLMVGQTYTSTNYSITLSQIANGTATFFVNALNISS